MVYVNVGHSFILSLEIDWETTLLGHQVELEWRLKVFSSNSQVLVLNFIAPKYTFYSLFYNSRLPVIFHEWSRSVFVASTVYFVWDTKPDFPTIPPMVYFFLSFWAPLSSFTLSRPICLSHGLVIHYSCCLGLMGFLSIYQLFSVRVTGLLLSTWASKMAINTRDLTLTFHCDPRRRRLWTLSIVVSVLSFPFPSNLNWLK